MDPTLKCGSHAEYVVSERTCVGGSSLFRHRTQLLGQSNTTSPGLNMAPDGLLDFGAISRNPLGHVRLRHAPLPRDLCWSVSVKQEVEVVWRTLMDPLQGLQSGGKLSLG